MKGWSQEAGIRRLLSEISKEHGLPLEVLEADPVDVQPAEPPGPDLRELTSSRNGDAGWVRVARPGGAVPGSDAVLGHAAAILSTYLDALAEVASLSGEVADCYEELNLLYSLGESLGALQEEQAIGSRVLQEAQRIIGGERGTILLEDGRGGLRIAASINLPEGLDPAAPIPTKGSLAGWTLRSGRGVLAETHAEIPREALPPGGDAPGDAALLLPPLLCVPLRYREEAIGVLLLCARAFSRPFSAHDMKLAQAIAAQGALFVGMARSIAGLRAGEQIRREVEIARTIQQALLPRRDPEIPGVQVAGRCRPAAAVGGDYYGFFEEVVPGMTGVTILDVSGHSVGSAVCLAAARSVLRCESWSRRSPREVIERVNEILFDDLADSGMYATLVYLLYDHRSGDLRYTNAGHPPPLLLRGGEERCRRLGAGGMGVGIAQRQSYREESMQLSIGDVLLLYTDGLIEARAPDGESFGEARLGRLLGKYRDASAWEVVSGLMGELDAFTAGTPPADDVALVAMRAVPAGRRPQAAAS